MIETTKLICRLLIGLIFVFAFKENAYAQLDDVMKIKYANGIAVQLGVGVDEFEPAIPKQFCLNFDKDTDIGYDTEGSTEAQVRTNAVYSMDDFENDFKFDYSATTTANLGIDKLLTANSTIKNTGKFEKFLKNTSNNFLINIEAVANHGSKRVVYTKGLQPKFQALLDEKKFAEFRKLCGTHFVSSHTLESEVAVAIDVKDISRTLKLTINKSTTANVDGSLTIEGITAGGSAGLTSNLTNILTLASSHGSIESQVRSRGGYGVGSVTSVLSGISYKSEEMGNIFKAIAQAGTNFDAKKAAPGEFNLISYEIFGAESPNLPSGTYQHLEKIYKKLIRVDAVVTQYETYKSDRPIVYEKYFKPKHDTLTSIRKNILDTYKKCRTTGECTIPETISSDSYPFLTDVFKEANLSARCTAGNEIENTLGNKGYYLSSIDFVISGSINYVSEVDQGSIKIGVSTPDKDLQSVSFNPKQRAAIYNINKEEDTGDVLMQIYNLNFRPQDITTRAGWPDNDKIGKIRNSLRDYVFQVETSLKSGEKITDYFGMANLECSGI